LGKLCYLFYFNDMQSKLKQQKLTLLSILLLVLFTFPFVSVANRAALVAGVPVLFLYIFIVWIIAIIVLYSIAEGKEKNTDE
jgi:Ca2+/Na+ antiporter